VSIGLNQGVGVAVQSDKPLAVVHLLYVAVPVIQWLQDKNKSHGFFSPQANYTD
jgi:hypothetical protein